MSNPMIFTNGRIYTQDTDLPSATAVAVGDGRILAVGSDDQVRSQVGSLGGEWIDLNGRCVLPGLVDAHVHFQWYSLSLLELDLFEVPSLDAALRRIATHVADLTPGKWLVGRGWTQELWEGHAFPGAADLDRVAAHVPICLYHKSGHAAWVNSKALSLAGVFAHTPDPAGGQIQRDARRDPTGILFEDAMNLVTQHIPPPTEGQVVEAMGLAQERCWEAGLTGLHDFDGRLSFQALQTMRRRGELGLRIVKNIPVYRYAGAIEVGLRSGYGDDWLRIGGVKMFADGALGPRTAAMIAPYENEPDNTGIVVTDKEEMKEVASNASANGLSVTVHAIGDRALYDVLDVYAAVREEEAQRKQSPALLRHRIEHVQVYHPSDLKRLAGYNIIASMQPTHAPSDMTMAERHWGERARYSYAWRDVLNSGALLVFGSDSPIEPIEPLRGIHAAVTRQRADGAPGPDGWFPEQRLTVDETVHAFTMAAALTSSQEDWLGSITPGKLADLTILERDIYTIPADEIREVGVAATMIGGEFKHREL